MDPRPYESKPPEPPPGPPPPHAFTQGVGTLFQFVGVFLFIGMMFTCCGSSLLSKNTAIDPKLTEIGWHLPSDIFDHPTFSAQRMLTIALPIGMFLGLALAGLGLGLQATKRRAPAAATIVCTLATLFWLVETIFVVQNLHSILLPLLGGVLTVIFAVLAGFSLAAVRDISRNPPAADQDILPDSFENPYSHLHKDPPEVRLARELAQRKQRLAVQQKEIEAMERSLQRKMREKGP